MIALRKRFKQKIMTIGGKGRAIEQQKKQEEEVAKKRRAEKKLRKRIKKRVPEKARRG